MKAGSTRARGPVEDCAPTEISVMTPSSCRSTTFSSRPWAGPENRMCAGTTVAMTALRHCEERSDEAIHLSPCGGMDCFAPLAMTTLVCRVSQFPLRARRQEFTRKNLRRRRRPRKLVTLDDDADGAGHAVVLDVADADFLHLGRDDQLVERKLQAALFDLDIDQIVVIDSGFHPGVLVLGNGDHAL